MTLRKNIFFSFLFLLVLPLYAYALPSHDKLLTTIGNRLAKGSEISFSYTAYKGKEIVDKNNGKLLMQGENFRLRLGSLDICYNGTNLSYYDFKENTFTKVGFTPEELILINPIVILRKGSQYFNIEERPGAHSGRIIVLKPQKDNSLFNRIDIHINKDNEIKELIIDSKNQPLIQITISQIVERTNFYASSFLQSEKQYPTAEVIDLR